MEIILIPLWLIGCVLVTTLAESKGQAGIVAFLVSFLLSPVLMLLVVLCRPNFKREEIEAKRHAELLEAAKSSK
ncbi:MAG: hypothetical protein ACRDA8_11290 [Shewanella sp.]